jgi:hypothetical protein
LTFFVCDASLTESVWLPRGQMPDGREWPCGEELCGPMALEFIRTVETSQEASDVEKVALGRLFLSFFHAPFDFFTDYDKFFCGDELVGSPFFKAFLTRPYFCVELNDCEVGKEDCTQFKFAGNRP